MRALTVVHALGPAALASRLAAGADWARLDALLAGPAFAALAAVTLRADAGALGGAQETKAFYFFTSDDLWDYLVCQRERTRVFFREKLPLLEAKGVLSVE